MIFIVPKRKTITPAQLIERDAHIVAKIRRLPISKYILSNLAAKLCRITHWRFLSMLQESETMHGFRVPTGEVYVHPDALIKKAARAGAHFCSLVASQTASQAERAENKSLLN